MIDLSKCFGFVDDGQMGNKGQSGYPSDVTDEEWAFVAPYLALCRENSERREYSLRTVFNGLRYIVRTGGQWRYMPNDKNCGSPIPKPWRASSKADHS